MKRQLVALTLVFLPSAPCKDFEQLYIALVFGWGVWRAEGLDCRGLEELREDVGVWARCGICDDLSHEARRCSAI